MKPKKIPSPISVKAVGKPIMITTTMSPKSEARGPDRSCVQLSPHPALARGFVDTVRVFDRDLARILIDVFAVCELLFDDVGLGDAQGGSATPRS